MSASLRRGAWAVVCFPLVALLAACGARPAADATVGPAAGARERISATTAAHLERTFDELLKTMEENYVYGAPRSVDWSSIRSRYRARIGEVRGVSDFAVVVRAALEEIGDRDVSWQSRDERIAAELEYSATTRYEGIGTYIGFRATPVPRVLILEVIPGSPAERAGLRPHDAILSIEGSPVRPDEELTVAQRIRGPRGTPVRLEVARPGGGRISLSVVRDSVDLAGVEYPTRAGRVTGTNIGYIQFPRSASEGLVGELKTVVGTLTGVGRLDGLVLDLRITGTGPFPLEGLLGLFADGQAGTAYTARGEEVMEVQGEDHRGTQRLPLAVLVGLDTQGYAEIFAAALQARARATVVGMRTPGSVESDQQFGLVDGSRLWLPVWSYRAPDGSETGLDGVVPDVAVDADWDTIAPGRDPVLDAAVRALRGVR